MASLKIPRNRGVENREIEDLRTGKKAIKSGERSRETQLNRGIETETETVKI